MTDIGLLIRLVSWCLVYSLIFHAEWVGLGWVGLRGFTILGQSATAPSRWYFERGVVAHLYRPCDHAASLKRLYNSIAQLFQEYPSSQENLDGQRTAEVSLASTLVYHCGKH